jgi:hypothetical protein
MNRGQELILEQIRQPGELIQIDGTSMNELKVTNNGNTATSGTITVVDVLPTGTLAPSPITLDGSNKDDWSCSLSGQVITCTSDVVIPAYADPSPGTSVFTIPVDVYLTAPSSLVNKARLGGGGDSGLATPDETSAGLCTGSNTPARGCAVDTDSTGDIPWLTLAKTNSADAVVKGHSTTYTFTVSNNSSADTSGDLTQGGAKGSDWSCTAAGQVITCASSAVIAATGNSVLCLEVSISETATGTLEDKARVGGGGDLGVPDPHETSTETCTDTDTPDRGCAVESDPIVTGVASVTVTVYVDANSNGGKDISESTIPLVTVDLFDSGGNLVATAQSDSNGKVYFKNLDPVSYTILETDLPGNISTPTT